MERELSLFCKNKNTEKFLNFKVLKTIGKKFRVKFMTKISSRVSGKKEFFSVFAGEEV